MEALCNGETEMRVSETKLLRKMDESLHAISQPVTVLLCALDYGAGLDSIEEMRQTMKVSRESCERLRASVVLMQSQLLEAIEADSMAFR